MDWRAMPCPTSASIQCRMYPFTQQIAAHAICASEAAETTQQRRAAGQSWWSQSGAVGPFAPSVEEELLGNPATINCGV